MSTIYWSSLFTVGGCGSEEGSLLWFALSWSAIQDLISVWLPRTMGKNMCSWMCCEPVYVNHQHAHQLTTTPCLLTAPCLRVGSNSELMFKETDLFPNTLWFFTPNYCSYLQLYEVTALDILCKNTLFGWTFSCCGACPAGVRDIKTRQLHSMQYRPSGKDSSICEALNWGQMACSNVLQHGALLLWKSMASSGKRNKSYWHQNLDSITYFKIYKWVWHTVDV